MNENIIRMFFRLFKLEILIFHPNRAFDRKNKNLLSYKVFHKNSENMDVSWKTKQIIKFFAFFLTQVAAFFIQCSFLEN